MRLTIYFWLATALVALGIGLLSHIFLATLLEVGAGGIGLLKRRFRPGQFQRLLGIQAETTDIDQHQRSARQFDLALLLASPWIWAILSVGLALFTLDPMLSPAALVLTNVAGVLYRSQQRQKRLAELHQRTSDLILQFAARYPLVRSVGQALQATLGRLPKGEVRHTVVEVIRRLDLNQPIAQAVAPFQRLPVHSLHQLAVILANAQKTTPTVFQDTLEMLRLDVESRRELHNLSRQSLTLIRSTARVLQAVLAGALIFVSLTPNWRLYFMDSTGHLMTFLAALGAGALGSLYIEAEIQLLEV